MFRSRLFLNVLSYGLVNFINAAIPFLLLPILTYYLSPSDYAIISLFQVMITFARPFAGLNFQSAVSVNFFHQEKINLQQYTANGVFILIASALTLAVFTYLFQSPLSNIIKFPAPWLIWVVIYIFFQRITDLLLVLWRVRSKPINFGLLKIVLTVIEITLSLVLIINFSMSWQGRVLSIIIAAICISLLSFIILIKNKWLEFKLNKKYIKDILNFGIPLIPHTLGSIILVFSDRLFIVSMLGKYELGLYTVGYQIGMILSLIQTSFNQAWSPWFYGKLKQDDHAMKLKIVKIIYLYILGLLLLVGLIYFIKPLIINFIDSSFSQSEKFIVWVALGFAFNGMYKMMVNFLIFHKKTKIIALFTVVIAVLNLILNYFLISAYGAVGAAIATSISFFAQFFVTQIYVINKYDMPWKLR